MTPETLALLADLIASVGFPIFVAVYLLVTFRKTLLDNTLATKTLTDLLQLWISDEYRYHLTEKGQEALRRSRE